MQTKKAVRHLNACPINNNFILFGCHIDWDNVSFCSLNTISREPAGSEKKLCLLPPSQTDWLTYSLSTLQDPYNIVSLNNYFWVFLVIEVVLIFCCSLHYQMEQSPLDLDVACAQVWTARSEIQRPFLGLIYINNKGGEAPYFRGPALKFFIGSLFTTLTHWSHWVPWVRPLGEGKGGGRVGCKFSNQSKGKRHSKTMRHRMYKQSWNIHIRYIMTWVICTSHSVSAIKRPLLVFPILRLFCDPEIFHTLFCDPVWSGT